MDTKSNNVLKIIALIVGAAVIFFIGYYLSSYKHKQTMSDMESKYKTEMDNLKNSINNTGENIKDGVENIGHDIGETVKDGVEGVTGAGVYTAESIGAAIKGEKDLMKEEIKDLNGLKVKNAHTLKIDNHEVKVYEFENEHDLLAAHEMDQKYKNMVRKGNALIDTTHEDFITKINNLK